MPSTIAVAVGRSRHKHAHNLGCKLFDLVYTARAGIRNVGAVLKTKLANVTASRSEQQ